MAPHDGDVVGTKVLEWGTDTPSVEGTNAKSSSSFDGDDLDSPLCKYNVMEH